MRFFFTCVARRPSDREKDEILPLLATASAEDKAYRAGGSCLEHRQQPRISIQSLKFNCWLKSVQVCVRIVLEQTGASCW
jgi:hypothetical protein